MEEGEGELGPKRAGSLDSQRRVGVDDQEEGGKVSRRRAEHASEKGATAEGEERADFSYAVEGPDTGGIHGKPASRWWYLKKRGKPGELPFIFLEADILFLGELVRIGMRSRRLTLFDSSRLVDRYHRLVAYFCSSM